jgi:hypothetical protein
MENARTDGTQAVVMLIRAMAALSYLDVESAGLHGARSSMFTVMVRHGS